MSVFADRRRRVLDALDDAALILPAAPRLFRSRDTEVPYRPDSDLFYLTECAEPDSVAVLAPDAEDGPFWLFVRPRDPEAERWSGPRLGPEGARERFGADAVHPIEELDARLGGLLESVTTLYCRPGAGSATDRLVEEALRFARTRGPRKGTGVRRLIDPGAILDDMRLIKDAGELDRMREAARISVEAFAAAIGTVRPGIGEWEIQAALDGGFRAGGGLGQAFETIVGSGTNACVLHYVDNADRVEAGDLVLMDAGASFGLYAADITRTVPADGVFSSPQREVYEIVDRARRAAIEVCVPGRTTADVHGAAVRVITEGLVSLGVRTGSVDELVEAGAHRDFFPHQTSHWLGLDVHDVGDYARRGEPRALEAGMVLTIEPGLYFAPGTEGVPEAFVGMGIRLEDDVHVTAEAPEVLTEDLPVGADEVQEMMA